MLPRRRYPCTHPPFIHSFILSFTHSFLLHAHHAPSLLAFSFVRFDWGTDCTVVCACTEFPSDSSNEDDAVEGCFQDGIVSKKNTYPWSQNVENLLEYIGSVRHTVDNVDTIVQAISAENDVDQVCGGMCTVAR